MSSMEELTGIVARMNADVDVLNALIREKQMKIGALQQKADQIDKLKKEIVALQEKQTEYAKEAADYDALKVAFSQSGVPHQIIRSIIPQLTATSNTILGQMTGGKMGVELSLHWLKSNHHLPASSWECFSSMSLRSWMGMEYRHTVTHWRLSRTDTATLRLWLLPTIRP